MIGVAKAMEIKAGGGDATDYEDFEGHLDYIESPKVTEASTTPDGTGSTPAPDTTGE